MESSENESESKPSIIIFCWDSKALSSVGVVVVGDEEVDNGRRVWCSDSGSGSGLGFESVVIGEECCVMATGGK